MFSLVPWQSTWHCYRSIFPAGGALSSKLAACCCCCRSMSTDRRTDRRTLDVSSTLLGILCEAVSRNDRPKGSLITRPTIGNEPRIIHSLGLEVTNYLGAGVVVSAFDLRLYGCRYDSRPVPPFRNNLIKATCSHTSASVTKQC